MPQKYKEYFNYTRLKWIIPIQFIHMRTVSILAFLFLQAAWLASCGSKSPKEKELNTPKAENTSALGGQPIAEKDAEAQAAFAPEDSLEK